MSFEPFDWVNYCVVLKIGRHDYVAGGVICTTLPEQTLDRQVVAFGSPGGEDDLASIATHRERELLPCVFEHHATGLPIGVGGTWIADRLQSLGECCENLGTNRHGCRVIEVNGHEASLGFCLCLSQCRATNLA